MYVDLRNRRDDWLKLSHEEFEGIKNLHGSYLGKEISRYAQYKLAEFREKELKPKAKPERTLPQWLKYSIYAALTALGVTVFTVLPSLITEQTGASDLVTQVARSIGGILLVFLGHWSVSLLLSEILLYIQYQTALKQLNSKLDSSRIILQQYFSQAQINYLEDVESPFGSYPSIFYILFGTLASLAEVGGLIFIFTKDNSSVNYFLMFIISIVPLFLLWTISFVTAYYDKVPKVNQDIVEIHFKKVMEINDIYRKKYLDDDIHNDHSADYYLFRMEGLLFDKLEKDESIINYLLRRLRLEDKRKNEVIETEGEIEYYKSLKIKLQNEDSNRRRDTIKSNNSQKQNQGNNYGNIMPNGEGGVRFHENEEDTKRNEAQENEFENDNKRAKELLDICTKEIEDLSIKLTDLQK